MSVNCWEREGIFMIQSWFEKNYIIYALTGIGALGVLLKLITNCVYIRLAKASSNMTASKNKLIKQMKLKFETFYKLKIGVNNVDIFVDKYVYKYRICGLLLSTWENLSGLMLMICLLITPIASIVGLIEECGESNILSTFLAGVSVSALLLIVDNLFNISAKQKIIKINMKDYLENYLKARLELEAMDPEVFAGYRAEMASGLEHAKKTRMQKREKRQARREEKERQKYLELEEKQREREEKRRNKIELKEMERAKKEEEKRLAEEERMRIAEEKAESKRRAIEEKKQKQEQKRLVKLEQEELARKEAEEKAARKRENSERRQSEKKQRAELERQKEAERKHEVNQQASAAMQLAKAVNETAASKSSKKKGNEKQTRIQERNERLKEEIQAQREQRAKDRQEGKDPFETYAGSKQVQPIKNYSKINDFDMEQEMRAKAAARQEEKRKEKNGLSQKEQASIAVMQTENKISLRGNSPSEDKVIDDILKEFLA